NGMFKCCLATFDLRYRQDPFVLLFVLLSSIVAAFTLLPDDTLSDEGFHWHQLLEYFAGRFDLVDSLTMLPGYHLAVYGLSELFSLTEIAEVRYACFALAIPALLFFFLTARHYDKTNSYPVSLQLFLCPIIFPFFFLLYTDIPSLAMVMASTWLVTTGRYQLAALIVGISLLFRQTNIVWLVMLWVLSLADMGAFNFSSYGIADFFHRCLNHLRRTALFFTFCLLFAVFLFLNEGVAIGDAGSHEIGIYPTQIFFLLFVLFFLFIPLHIANFPKIAILLKKNPLLPFSGALLFAIYIITFDTSHGYNVPEMDFFLRNNLLELIRTNFLTKTLTFIPIIIAFFSLAVTPLHRRSHYWIYPFMALSLLPTGLIEQRYFIIPIALFMLFRKPLDRGFEYFQVTLYVPFTVYIFQGIAQHRFFL
ncbi:MAG TPA: hypothetical protein VF268_01050, partial [Gammaproteobacteria bacterium]